MAHPDAVDIARRYLAALRGHRLPVKNVVLFGSFARGSAQEQSDIDLLVVLEDALGQAEFDRISTKLWSVAREVDIRIEPLAVSETDWLHDEATPILQLVRLEGIPAAA